MPISTTRMVMVLTAMFVVVAGAFAGLLGFMAIGTALSDDVEITSGLPDCSGTALRGRSETIKIRPGMRCRVPVTVRNAGRLEVNLDEVELPFMGSVGGGAVRVTTWDGRAAPEDELAAVFGVDRRLAPGDTWDTEIQYEFRPGGCTARGTVWANAVMVKVSAWGRSAHAIGRSAVFAGTPQSEC